MIALCLIDNGSSLNVMPKSTLNKLPIDDSYLKPSFTVVRAFDGTKRKVIGEISLPIQVGPKVFEVDFHVMDINPAYSLLLGRPWLHTAGVVPSSLHQKLKFVIDGKLVEVFGEEDMLVSRAPNTPYIEAAEEALESAFQTFEVENISYVGDNQNLRACIAQATLVSAKCLVKDLHYTEWQEALREPIQLKENKNRSGLGYTTKGDDLRRIQLEKKRKRMSRFRGAEIDEGLAFIPYITSTFRSAGKIHEISGGAVPGNKGIQSGLGNLHISMVSEETIAEGDWVRQLRPGEVLSNWVSTELPSSSLM
ncbi:hypothetical protein LINGRAPRIM_LOCUS2534 [Linum grandiflorum]